MQGKVLATTDLFADLQLQQSSQVNPLSQLAPFFENQSLSWRIT